MSDPAVADQLTFAFIQANDVWVSLRGAPPQQITHLGLGTQQLNWFLLWSEDQTRLLAVASNNPSSGTATSEAWIIGLPGKSVQSLPSSAVASACADHSCAWLEDRYIVHMNTTRPGSHYLYYKIYDTQAQHDLSTGLDSQEITFWQVRGSSVFFTPYDNEPTFALGAIKRFDFNSNQITTQFTLPGTMVAEGIPSGVWDLSADAREVVVEFDVGT
ncbi:MAG TPA: hypothetical protein VKQ36_04250, partial [Ktedonobacterales bacterium]|nr:hypothetical protein [Ktedonobacterales bacterium]